MKSSHSLLLLLGSILFLPSCHTWGPNQRAGTVAGAAIGSGVGAIVGSTQGDQYRHGRYGYYRGGGNTAEGALIGLAAGAIAGNLIGAHVDRHQTRAVTIRVPHLRLFIEHLLPTTVPTVREDTEVTTAADTDAAVTGAPAISGRGRRSRLAFSTPNTSLYDPMGGIRRIGNRGIMAGLLVNLAGVPASPDNLALYAGAAYLIGPGPGPSRALLLPPPPSPSRSPRSMASRSASSTRSTAAASHGSPLATSSIRT